MSLLGLISSKDKSTYDCLSNENESDNDNLDDDQTFSVKLQVNSGNIVVLKTLVCETMSVDELKNIIMKEQDISDVNGFSIKCNLTNSIMESGKLLRDYGVIDDNHLIYLEMKETQLESKDNNNSTGTRVDLGELIIMDDQDNHVCSIHIPSMDATMLDIKKLIYKETNTPVNIQVLTYNDLVVFDDEYVDLYLYISI